MVSIRVVMGGQMSTSMVVDEGWVCFSFSFTFDKMMVGCLNMSQGSSVNGCNTGGQWGSVWVSCIRGYMGVSRVKWVARGSIGNNFFGFSHFRGSLNSNSRGRYDSLKDMIRMNHGLSIKMSSLGSHNRGSVLRYNSSIGILNKTIGHMSSPMMNSVKM